MLFESASGYALLERLESEEIGQELAEVQAAMRDLGKFGKIVKLKSFVPFKSAAHALENINDITEGIVNDHLKTFLEANMPAAKPGKKSKAQLAVADAKLGGAIQDGVGISCVSTEVTDELLRGVRLHFSKLVKQFKGAFFFSLFSTLFIGCLPAGLVQMAMLSAPSLVSATRTRAPRSSST